MKLLDIINSGNTACLAAVLLAIGVEVEEPMLKHIFDILGGLVAVLGFFASRRGGGEAT